MTAAASWRPYCSSSMYACGCSMRKPIANGLGCNDTLRRYSVRYSSRALWPTCGIARGPLCDMTESRWRRRRPGVSKRRRPIGGPRLHGTLSRLPSSTDPARHQRHPPPPFVDKHTPTLPRARISTLWTHALREPRRML
eukprot:356395-Chlamydomonas_euryale.AAC.10